MNKTLIKLQEKLICDTDNDQGEEVKLDWSTVQDLWRSLAHSLGDNDFYWEIKTAILSECMLSLSSQNTHYVENFIYELA